MEELLVDLIGCIAELFIDFPRLLEYRWARWTFGILFVSLVSFVIYFYSIAR